MSGHDYDSLQLVVDSDGCVVVLLYVVDTPWVCRRH